MSARAMRLGVPHIFGVAIIWAIGSLSPASADCFTASTAEVTKECHKQFVLQADQSLNEGYNALIALASDTERQSIKSEQRQWLGERNSKCQMLPEETNQPHWTFTILADNKKVECVIQETVKRAHFLSFELGLHQSHPVALPHSHDGLMYTWLKPDTTLDAYLGALRKNYELYDNNHDGVISIADLNTGRLSNATLESFLGQGVQPDHPLTWDTVASKGTAYFRYFDRNNDGFVSADEFYLVKELEISLELGSFKDSGDSRIADGCVLPKPSPDARIVLLSAYEAKAVSSVEMHNSEVRAGLIRISPGHQPIYLILTSFRPVIWKFEGDVSRLQTVVLKSMSTGPNSGAETEGLPLAGAVGLKRSQVFFPARVDCIKWFNDHPSPDSVQSIEAIQRQFDRLPDVVSAAYGVTGFTLPDGTEIKSEGGDATEWQNLRTQVDLFYPGGVIPMNADQVVSSQPVKTYNVLPGVAGLRQLVEQGALVALPGFHTFRVTRAIELPDGLYGADLAVFVLPMGVPMPKGDLGHSCIKAESDGKALAGKCPF